MDLIQIVDAALASAAARSGSHLVCRPGCSQCCHGVFEITTEDARRLREGLAGASPDLAARIQDRIDQSHAKLASFLPGDAMTGVLGEDAQAIELFEEAFHAEPCPILDPASQTCDLYAHRPILCRTFGPPIRNDYTTPEAGLAVCELCFTAATEEDILAAEMDCSWRPVEEAQPNESPTMIPFAFAHRSDN